MFGKDPFHESNQWKIIQANKWYAKQKAAWIIKGMAGGGVKQCWTKSSEQNSSKNFQQVSVFQYCELKAPMKM